MVAGGSVAGAGWTALVAIVSTTAALCTSGIIAVRTGAVGRGGEGRSGALAGTGGTAIGSMEGTVNAPIDRARGVDAFSEARVGTMAVRTPKSVACATTLSHKPLLKRD